MGVPEEGEFVMIQSYRHDGRLHRTWRDTMVLETSEHPMIGVNDHTLVTESDGRRWITHEPAIVYFHKKYWFGVIAIVREKGISYYCDLAPPFSLDDEALKYIGYGLGIKIFPDGEKRLLDIDEYEMHSKMMSYPNDIDFILKENVKILVGWIDNGDGPFSESYIDIWYSRYKQLSRKQTQKKAVSQ